MGKSLVQLGAAISQLARQRDDLADDKLCHAAGVAERRIEYRDAPRIGCLQWAAP